MLSYSQYKKNKYLNKLNKTTSIQESLDCHFEILRFNLLESLRIDYPILEDYSQEANELLALICEQDYLFSKKVADDAADWCKSNFNQFLLERIDFDSYLQQGPVGLDKLDNIQQLKAKIKWAIDSFVKQVKQMVLRPVVSNRSAAPQTAPSPKPSGNYAAPMGSSPDEGDEDYDLQPAPTASQKVSKPSVAKPTPQNQPSNTPQKGSFWGKKAKTPLGKLLWNIPRSAAAGAWNWLKNKYHGQYLDDSVRAELINLVENLFVENEDKILAVIDAMAASLTKYVDKNLDDFVKSVTTSGPSTSTATTSPATVAPTVNPSVNVPNAPEAKPLVPGVNALEPRDIQGGEEVVKKKRGMGGLGKPMDPKEFENAIKNGEKIPRHKPISQDALNDLSQSNEDGLRNKAAKKKGQKELRDAARALGLTYKHGGKFEDYLNLASEIYNKLQDPEVRASLNIGASNEPSPSAPQPQEVPPEENPTLTSSRPLPGSATTPQSSEPTGKTSDEEDDDELGLDKFANFMGDEEDPIVDLNPPSEKEDDKLFPLKNDKEESPETFQGEPSSGEDLESKVQKTLDDIKHEYPDVETDKIRSLVRNKLQKGEDPGAIIDAIGSSGAKKKEPEPVVNQEPKNELPGPQPMRTIRPLEKFGPKPESGGLDQRASKLHHEISQVAEKLKKGISTEDGPIALRNAESGNLDVNDIKNILNNLAQQKGGLDKVSEDDAYEAAMKAYEDKYISNNPDMENKRDAIQSKINHIIQSSPPSQEKNDDDGDDFSHFIEDEPEQESPEPQEEGGKAEMIYHSISPELKGNVPKEELMGMINHLLEKNPDIPDDVIARRVGDMIKVYSQTESIYQGLDPKLKAQGSPEELKSMIGEMLSKKPTLGRAIKPEQVPVQLENALFKKKISKYVDEVKKNIDFPKLVSMYGEDKLADAEIYRRLSNAVKSGDDPKTAISDVSDEINDLFDMENIKNSPEKSKETSEKMPDIDEKDPALNVLDDLRSEMISNEPRVSYYNYLLKKVFDNEESKLRTTIENELQQHGDNYQNVVKKLMQLAKQNASEESDPFAAFAKKGSFIGTKATGDNNIKLPTHVEGAIDRLKSKLISDDPEVTYYDYILHKMFDGDENNLESSIENELRRNKNSISKVTQQLMQDALNKSENESNPFAFAKNKSDDDEEDTEEKEQEPDIIPDDEDREDLDYNDLENY